MPRSDRDEDLFGAHGAEKLRNVIENEARGRSTVSTAVASPPVVFPARVGETVRLATTVGDFQCDVFFERRGLDRIPAISNRPPHCAFPTQSSVGSRALGPPSSASIQITPAFSRAR
jgi:hypothetical protein